MSRYTITVTSKIRIDPDAIIGYDAPLRTYFLQAFAHKITDEPALSLGTHHRAFEMLEDLHRAAVAHSCRFMPLPPEVAKELVEDKIS